MKVFPRWSEILGLGAEIVGYDIALNAPARDYEQAVQTLQEDSAAKGALVTTHKLDLYAATKDSFAELDDYAQLCAEVSCISKRAGKLIGHAKDPITSGLAVEAFVPKNYWQETGAHALCFGAGGAALAISLYLSGLETAPEKLTLVDTREERLAHCKSIHEKWVTETKFDYILNRNAEKNDTLLEAQPPHSLIINATGMGKDLPGSPISDGAQFPEHALVWEINYRGELDFYHQAKAQEKAKRLHVEDGWTYFLHGWTQVIAEVFQIDITKELFEKLGEI